MSNLKYKVGDEFISNVLGSKIEIIDDDYDYYQCSTELGHIIELDDELLNNGYTKIKDIKQIGGNHYSKLGIEPYEYSIKNDLNCYQFNVIKYVTRYKDKNGIEDLKKAINTLEKLIDYEGSTN
tara:strand:- start:831 stop:1202 length:372 start_codon:yes stop_codon:yes gene_type:complete